MNSPNRQLTSEERALLQWMLAHGSPAAASFLVQLDQALVTPWECRCGCASVNFSVPGQPVPSGAMNILADFVFGSSSDLSGIFVYEQGGVLAGLEVYGLAGDAPKTLPAIEVLRPFADAK